MSTLTFSSSGVGGNNHLAGALFAEAAGIKMIHVPYKGTRPAVADVISGQITRVSLAPMHPKPFVPVAQ